MRLLISVAAAAILLASQSHAAVLDLTGSTTNQTLSNYDPNGTTGLSNGGTVLRLYPTGALELTQKADVTFTYLGKEAGHTNEFKFNGTAVFNTSSTPIGAVNTSFTGVAAGVLDFLFRDTATGIEVKNGFVGSALYQSISVYMESGGSWLALFNDDCTCDTDFDDMVVRISAVATDGGNNMSPVPVPAALPLLGTGIAGLGYMARRRKKKA